ncbi:DUF1772 domain-containing protein [Mycobacterium malmoense]|uniref:DUF1772 domain-containing protein n=1 Tax=Mycobacterium malmoense TaxID=1780 RepID=UPI0008F90A4B|nr:DUF1772 domain-containing protein [Mycobacterium malmoense]OIN82070.1 hypothetical protein BMG05_04410 [Mycobacterium malmoense]
MDRMIDGLAIVITGSMVGVEFAVVAFANPVLARLPDDSFRAARGDAGRLLGKVMPFWYAAALLLLVAATIAASGAARCWLLGIAAGLMAGVMLLSVTVLVPINNRIAAWPAGGEPSRRLAARWDRLHWLRVGILAVLFAILTVAAT